MSPHSVVQPDTFVAAGAVVDSPMPSSGRAPHRVETGLRLADELPERFGVLGDNVAAQGRGLLAHGLIPWASATAWEAFARPKP